MRIAGILQYNYHRNLVIPLKLSYTENHIFSLMNRLHILRKIENPEAERLIDFQVREGDQVEVILIQEAVLLRRDFGTAAQAACAEDAASRHVNHHHVTLDYAGILNKIMETPSLVCW